MPYTITKSYVTVLTGCACLTGIIFLLYAVNGSGCQNGCFVTVHGLRPLIVTIRGDMESLLLKIAPHS